MLRDALKNVPGLRSAFRWSKTTYHQTVVRSLTRSRIKNAMSNGCANLHFGSGSTRFANFINADIYTGDIYINLLKTLPFESSTIDNIYSHHVFEHFELAEAEILLTGLFRILKPGGAIRLTMPDLDLILDQKRMSALDCVDYYYSCNKKSRDYENKYVVAFNELMHQEGEHKFIYNFELAKELLEKFGFVNVRRYEHGVSDSPLFRGLDPHSGACVARVSMAIEANKPL